MASSEVTSQAVQRQQPFTVDAVVNSNPAPFAGIPDEDSEVGARLWREISSVLSTPNGDGREQDYALLLHQLSAQYNVPIDFKVGVTAFTLLFSCNAFNSGSN